MSRTRRLTDRTQSRRSGQPRLSIIAAIACVALLAGVSAAQAAVTTIGSNLSSEPEDAQNCGPCTEALTGLASAQVTAPCTGTIVAWHVRGFMSSGTGEVRLRVLKPNGSGAYVGAGTSPPITLDATDEVHQASTSLPIGAGDFIGLDVPTNLTFVLAEPVGATTSIWEHGLAEGGAATAPSFTSGLAVSINAEIACSYTLSVSNAGAGSGAVTSTDGSINCGTTCSSTYDSGTAVTLTATPAPGSTFTGWSGACTGTGACRLTIAANESVTATFALTPVTLSVTKTGTGGGTVTSADGSINCGTTCSSTYDSGTAVTLTAAPAPGSTFTGWSGACTGTGACRLTITTDESVAATFARVPPPNTKITSSAISSKHSRATFKFVAIGSASGFQCALTKAPKPHHRSSRPSFSACRSPRSYTHLQAGSYTFLVRAFNAAGPDPTPASKTFTIHA